MRAAVSGCQPLTLGRCSYRRRHCVFVAVRDLKEVIVQRKERKKKFASDDIVFITICVCCGFFPVFF